MYSLIQLTVRTITRVTVVGTLAVLMGCQTSSTSSTPSSQKSATSPATKTVSKPASTTSSDASTSPASPYAVPGFAVRMKESRLWVFRENSKELSEFDKQGELARCVTRPGGGPDQLTIRAPDNTTIDEYMQAYKKIHPSK